MKVFALADLHLCLSVPSKTMEVFAEWSGYVRRIEEAWRDCVSPSDLVLLPGDITWAKQLDEAAIDLQWIDQLPGTKVMIRGNHDYWWSSSAKMAKVMPPSMHFIHNNALQFGDIAVGGTRLWDTPEYHFGSYTIMRDNPKAKRVEEKATENEDAKIFAREIDRLRSSLSQMPSSSALRLVMTHYPPIGADLQPSAVSQILEQNSIHTCVFGHLHSLDKLKPMFGQRGGVRYVLTSADYLDFCPKQIL